MATFQAIGLNLAIGSTIFVASLVAFSAAVHWEWNAELAPRTWARPRQVLKNVLTVMDTTGATTNSSSGSPTSTTTAAGANSAANQTPRRSWYGLAWIPWTLRLSYQQMLEGIPGTGTRNGGKSGTMLRCNLDGIIAVKFHALCFKVAIVATILCVGIILPINVTADCDPNVSGPAICANITGLTNFEVTTLAHIPPMDYVEEPPSNSTNGTTTPDYWASLERYFWTSPGITSRLFVIVIISWIIFLYTCALIWNEWIDNLALRRVFYLEHDHFRERRDELQYLATLTDPELEYQKKRPPYIPHPEIRDTVPNVSLYSVLYKLPDYFYSTATSTTASMLDRQLSATADFFDRCVPNQPGFSSSVAAVTILPDSAQVAKAWKKWYACASKLRRLRFIRSRIRQLERQNQGPPPQQQQQQQQQGQDTIHASSIATSTNYSLQTELPREQDDPEITNMTNNNNFNFLPIDTNYNNNNTSSGSPITTPRSLSPRHPQRNVLSTVEEFEDLSSEPRDLSFLSRSSQNTQDLESIGKDTTTSTTIANDLKDPPDVIVNELPDFGSCLGEVPESHESVMVSHVAQASASASTSSSTGYEGETSTNNPTSTRRESSLLYTGSFETHTHASWVPSISTASDTSSSPLFGHSNNTGKPSTAFSNHKFASSVDYRRSPDTVGHAEEAKLDLFLCDEGMEQLSVYCREFAQSSAGCCPYGCDHSMLKEADLEILKELEEEAHEDLQEANRALIAIRASVTKTEVDLENQSSGSSFITRLRHRSPTPPTPPTTTAEATLATRSMSVSDRRYRDNREQPLQHIRIPTTSAIERERCSTGSSTEVQWQMAAEIAIENRQHHHGARGRKSRPSGIPSGSWFSSAKSRSDSEQSRSSPTELDPTLKKGNIVSSMVDYHTYAVVTFTSRQAAIAARQCMADGSGLGRWEELDEIPIPPLADSVPCDFCLCRGCCRPVTFTINDSQKRCRKNIVWVCLVLFCCLYTIPLSLTSSLVSPRQLAIWFPTVDDVGALSGILTGMLYTGFFSVCPFIFKSLANFGSGATSLRQADFLAIRYYWIFILVTAFTGSSLATMLTSGLYSGLNLGDSAQEVLRQVAKTIPTQVSATWLNWIIVRFTYTIPVMYFFQSNTFLFKLIGWDCCARCTRGGGPGGPLPFRIYVDSGAVFLCVVALAPACPLVAPAGMCYYLVFSPVLRWLLIFVQRPEYDGGGKRWPILHEILISSMIVAQVLLTTMMVLKKGYGPAVLASLPIFPTYAFGQIAKERFLRCYNDAGLVQTSQLDGWDESKPMSPAEREEFRKWLVDCHKASYIPICLAGIDSNLTAEPAVVLHGEQESTYTGVTRSVAFNFEPKRPRTASQDSMFGHHRPRSNTLESAFASSMSSAQSYQKGALYRRVPFSSSTSTHAGTPDAYFPA